MCASAVVMLDTPCSEVVWRVLATHSIRKFPLHFPYPCVTVCRYISTGVYVLLLYLPKQPTRVHKNRELQCQLVALWPHCWKEQWWTLLGLVVRTSALLVLCPGLVTCDSVSAAKTAADVAKQCGAFVSGVKHTKNASETGRPWRWRHCHTGSLAIRMSELWPCGYPWRTNST